MFPKSDLVVGAPLDEDGNADEGAFEPQSITSRKGITRLSRIDHIWPHAEIVTDMYAFSSKNSLFPSDIQRTKSVQSFSLVESKSIHVSDDKAEDAESFGETFKNEKGGK